MDETLWLIGALAVVIGSTLQRLSGTGVGLVVGPTLALLVGPATGILLTNATTVVSATVITAAVRTRIEWRRAGLVLLASLPGTLFGAWVVIAIPAAWLSILIGTVVILALVLVTTAKQLPETGMRNTLIAAGFVGGIFNTTAGVAAPALIIGSRLARWSHAAYAATLQPIFLGMGVSSVAMKLAIAPVALSTLPPWWVLPLFVGGVLAGLGLGTWLDARVPHRRAQQLAMLLAGAGGAAVLVRGAVQLLASSANG